MSKLKELIESTGFSYKKQIGILITLNIIIVGSGLGLYIYLKNTIIIGFVILLLGLLNYAYLSRYSSIKKTYEEAAKNEFIGLLSFLKTYITNGFSIYQSLEELTNYTSGLLLNWLERLISDIDDDKSVTPFISFSNHFHSLQIEQLLICLYQMVDEGSNVSYLTQFELLFNKLREESIQNALSSKNNALSNCSMFPLIGSALLIIMITFGIVSVIGESLNGI